MNTPSTSTARLNKLLESMKQSLDRLLIEAEGNPSPKWPEGDGPRWFPLPIEGMDEAASYLEMGGLKPTADRLREAYDGMIKAIDDYLLNYEHFTPDRMELHNFAILGSAVRFRDFLADVAADVLDGERQPVGGTGAGGAAGEHVTSDDANGSVTSPIAMTRSKKKLPPSRLMAHATYEYAMAEIVGADNMTISELHKALLKKLDAEIGRLPPNAAEAEHLQALRDKLPKRASTFGKYLREAGVKRYDGKGERIRRISHRARNA